MKEAFLLFWNIKKIYYQSFGRKKSIFRSISVETCQEFDRNYAIDSLEDYNRLKSAKEVEQVNQSEFRIVNNYVD